MNESASLWSLVGVPLLIFGLRVVDVGLGTLRVALVSRGMQRAAPMVGFFESLFWILAISQVLGSVQHPIHYLGWAGGYATGTWVGLKLEERLALGLIAVRVITESDASELMESLRTAAFGVTVFEARGLQGRVRFILSVIRRSDLERYLAIVREKNPKAFVSVSDVRSANEGFFSGPATRGQRLALMLRK